MKWVTFRFFHVTNRQFACQTRPICLHPVSGFWKFNKFRTFAAPSCEF